MLRTLLAMKKSFRVIGFTGSELTDTEETCLKMVFKTTPVVFPNLSLLKKKKVIQVRDQMTIDTKEDYLIALESLVKARVYSSPVVIVANNTY